MKRPVFRAVIVFALGEVLGLCTDGMVQIGIAMAVLICTALFWGGKRQGLVWLLMLIISGIFGFANVRVRERQTGADLFFSAEQKGGDICGAIGDDVSEPGNDGGGNVFRTDNYSVAVQGGMSDAEWDITGYGYVHNITDAAGGRHVTLRMVYTEGEYGYTEASYLLMVYGVEEDINIGDYVSVSGAVSIPSQAANPGGFDARSYYRARGIRYMMRRAVLERGEALEAGKACETEKSLEMIFYDLFYAVKNGLYKLRTYFGGLLYELAGEEAAGTFAGILLGDKSGLTDRIRGLYQRAGISHILAISGLHVSIIGMALFRFFRRIGVRHGGSGCASIFLIVLYGGMTGWGLSTMRAVIMLTLVFFGEMLGRSSDIMTGMSISLFLLLFFRPYKIYDGGLWLSFAAVGGICLKQYIHKRLLLFAGILRMKRRNRILYGMVNALLTSLCVQLTTAPVVAWLYGVIPVYSVLLNLIVIPLMTVVVVSGMAAMLLGCISVALGSLCIWPGRLILAFYSCLCELVQSLPGCSINTGRPDALEMLLYYTLLFGMAGLSASAVQRRMREWVYKHIHKWFSRRAWCGIMALVYLGVFGAGGVGIGFLHRFGMKEQIIFLDVGQGDGILIRTAGGRHMVIDGGSVSNKGLAEYVIKPALNISGMARVDYWFVSHTDEDHISGLLAILEEGRASGISIRHLVFSRYAVHDDAMEELLLLAEASGIQVLYMSCGDTVTDGENFYIKCLHPDRDFTAKDKNQGSLALEYRSVKLSALFTGDMDAAALEYMLGHTESGHYDILKVAHHGSVYSLSQQLYNKVDIAVISCGRKNGYGHPHAKLLDALAQAELPVYRTDCQGAVLFTVRRYKWLE